MTSSHQHRDWQKPVLFYGKGFFIHFFSCIFFVNVFLRNENTKKIQLKYFWFFALFTTFDINLIRAQAKACRRNPDYIDASMGIFLDFLNLITSSADILSD